MAAIPIIAQVFAVVGSVAAVYGTIEAKSARDDAAREARKAQNEQIALQASKQAEEKRKQIREERIRRARIEQGSENSGSSGSAGELGALSNLASGLSYNVGSAENKAQAGNRISGYLQNQANFDLAATNAQFMAQNGMTLFGVGADVYKGYTGNNIFSKAAWGG